MKRTNGDDDAPVTLTAQELRQLRAQGRVTKGCGMMGLGCMLLILGLMGLVVLFVLLAMTGAIH